MSESNSPRVAILTSEGYQWNRALVALEQKANNFLKENPHYRFMLGSISHSAGMGGQSTFEQAWSLSDVSHVMVPGGTKGGQFHHFRYVVMLLDE